jgi:hypothetical protein
MQPLRCIDDRSGIATLTRQSAVSYRDVSRSIGRANIVTEGGLVARE